MKAEVRKREENIKEKQQFLDNEIENNKEQEKKISLAERLSAKFRIDYQEAETQRVQFQDEVHFVFFIALEYIFIKHFLLKFLLAYFHFCSLNFSNKKKCYCYMVAFTKSSTRSLTTYSVVLQLDALKRTVDRTATDLEVTRSQVSQLKKDVQEKTNKYLFSSLLK